MGVGRWVSGIGNAVDTVVLAEGSGRGAVGGVRDTIAGVGGLQRVDAERRRAANRAKASVNGEFYHDDADRLDLLARLNSDFDKFRADIEPGMTAPGVSEARSQWWTVDVLPALTEWKEFLQRESSWIARFATEWSTYAEWLGRLKTMRSDARVQGIALHSPEPAPIPRTLFERGATGFGSQVDTVWTTGRVLLYAVLGITGVVALRSAWKDLRDFREQRKEPHE
jgi:hypothetical protein